MSSPKSVFLIGPGFIGLHVLDLLLSSGYSVTALVRREAAAHQLRASGALPVIGTLDDASLITHHVLSSSIVIHTATADHLPSVAAVLDGLTQRAEQGKSTIFIHTSGTSVLHDDVDGASASSKTYSDDRPSQIDAVPDTAPHRPIDLAIIAARKRLGTKAKLAIMIPPEIYGFSAKHKRLSIQVPALARFALKHGFAGYVGEGKGVWSQVHVADLARGYVTLLHWMESSTPEEVLENPYFFCENGAEFSWHEVGTEVARSLHDAGKIQDPEPREIPKELWGDLFGDMTHLAFGVNSRSRAKRLRALGWEPREKGIWDSWREDELPHLLTEETGS